MRRHSRAGENPEFSFLFRICRIAERLLLPYTPVQTQCGSGNESLVVSLSLSHGPPGRQRG